MIEKDPITMKELPARNIDEFFVALKVREKQDSTPNKPKSKLSVNAPEFVPSSR